MVCGAATLATAPAHTQATPDAPEKIGTLSGDDASASPGSALLNMPLEDLLTLESTSVARKRQRVQDSAAAVYIISREDIQRSAAKTIPDLLRGVPGVEVALASNGGYAVTIRGFNSEVANALLVMIDGRSIYVSTFSGVFWDELLIPLGDIERIEVVRGPGGTLWGANAVNGVINIVTRHSADTQDTQANARAGGRWQEFTVSHGGRFTEGLNYRVYGAFRRDKGLVLSNGDDSGAAYLQQAAGGRLDWEPNERDVLTAQVDYAGGHFTTPFTKFNGDYLNPGEIRFQGRDSFSSENIVARWTHQQDDRLDWSIQAYYERIDRNSSANAHLIWNQADIETTMHWKASAVHDINFGVDTRLMFDHTDPGVFLHLADPDHTDRWVSGFVQDDISFIPDRLRLTIGTKLEYNNFTGFDFQPSARLFVRPERHVALWAAVSRAVRTPSRFERSSIINSPPSPANSVNNPLPLPVYAEVIGALGTQSETLLAYELGARANLGAGWSLDVAAYYNDYKKLTSIAPLGATPIFVPPIPYPVGINLDLGFMARGKAHTYGVETVLKGQLAFWWQTELTWSHFDYSLLNDPTTGLPYSLIFPLNFSPHDQIAWRNNFDITRRLALSGQLIHVSKLPGSGVPAYTDLDLRVNWQISSALSLSLIGEHLFHKRKLEFVQVSYPGPQSYQPRQITAQLGFRF